MAKSNTNYYYGDTSYAQFHEFMKSDESGKLIDDHFKVVLQTVRAKDGYTNQTYNPKQNKGEQK